MAQARARFGWVMAQIVLNSQSYARGQGVAFILTNTVLAGSVNHSFTGDFGVPEWVKENGPAKGGCALVYVLPGFSSRPDWHKQYMVICKSFAVHTSFPPPPPSRESTSASFEGSAGNPEM